MHTLLLLSYGYFRIRRIYIEFQIIRGGRRKNAKNGFLKSIQICIQYNYQYLFAGYGFMAEDAGFVEEVQKRGIQFIGPSPMVHRLAGTKDTAKKLARELKISVTPGLDNISALTLLKKAKGSKEGLRKEASKNGLKSEISNEHSETEEEYAESLLQVSYREGKPLIHIDEIQSCAREEGAKILRANPTQRTSSQVYWRRRRERATNHFSSR